MFLPGMVLDLQLIRKWYMVQLGSYPTTELSSDNWASGQPLGFLPTIVGFQQTALGCLWTFEGIWHGTQQARIVIEHGDELHLCERFFFACRIPRTKKWRSEIPDFRNFGHPDFRKSRSPEFRNSGHLDFPNPDIPITGVPNLWKSGNPDFRIVGYANSRIFPNQHFRISREHDIILFEASDAWYRKCQDS